MAIDIGTVAYNEAIAAVTNYYQVDPADVINTINEYNMTPEDLYNLVPTLDKVWNTTYSNSGAVLGTDTISNIQFAGNDVASQAAAAIDSNVATASQATKSLTNIPAQSTISGGNVTMTRGLTSVATGNPVLAVADKVGLGVLGVSIGCKAGAFIDRLAYTVGGLIWDDIPEELNPETWDDMATTEEGKQLIRTIFGLHDDGTSAMYVPENVFAAYMLAMTKMGLFNDGSTESTIPEGLTLPTFRYWTSYPPIVAADISRVFVSSTGNDPIYVVHCQNGDLRAGSKSPFTLTLYGYRYTNPPSINYDTTNTYSSGSPDHASGWPAEDNLYHVSLPDVYKNFIYNINYSSANQSSSALDMCYTLVFGDTVTKPLYPGVTPQPGASLPVINPNASIADVLAQLKSLYPDLWDNAITESVVQPDGTTKTYTYVPMPVTDTSNLRESEPTNTTTTQNDYIVDPNSTPQDILDTITRYLTGTQQTPDGENVPLDPTENPPETGDGDTPDVVLPTGSANALYSIYNPSQAELNSFGSWLWSSNFVDQLLKLFNDPMQAIIGLHKVFATPPVSGTGNIKVGYLDSGVSSNIVGSQYTTIDCGQISILEYFGNVFDYDPFTCVYIYLPFIGIEKLDTGDVMRGQLRVVYHVDVLTGACLAEIRVIRDISGGTLYTFTGNCAVQYPISSGSYMGIVTSLASIAGGVVGTIASGGALAPVAMGAVSGALNAHTRVQHSGGFSGNAGAMGIKTPYVIITRPQTCLPDNFPAFDGYPSNDFVKLSECSGYVKVESCHITNTPATDAELLEIESLLKTGIII